VVDVCNNYYIWCKLNWKYYTVLLFIIKAESEFTIHVLNLGYSESAPSHAEHRSGQACRHHYYCYYCKIFYCQMY